MINLVQGDAISGAKQTDGYRVITHCCNDCQAWGAGFVVSLSKAFNDVEPPFSSPEKLYRAWGNAGFFGPNRTPFALGNVQFVTVDDGLYVANMIGQHGVGPDKNGNPPVRYNAIKECFEKVLKVCHKIYDTFGEYPSIHSPLLGCGLAMGSFDEILGITKEVFDSLPEVTFTFYAFTNEDYKQYKELFVAA